jgi:hypothetical protein
MQRILLRRYLECEVRGRGGEPGEGVGDAAAPASSWREEGNALPSTSPIILTIVSTCDSDGTALNRFPKATQFGVTHVTFAELVGS